RKRSHSNCENRSRFEGFDEKRNLNGPTSRRKSLVPTRPIRGAFLKHRRTALEQNPDTKSRWAKMVREGNKEMQFLVHSGTVSPRLVAGELKMFMQKLCR